jgi:hypothetical protein
MPGFMARRYLLTGDVITLDGKLKVSEAIKKIAGCADDCLVNIIIYGTDPPTQASRKAGEIRSIPSNMAEMSLQEALAIWEKAQSHLPGDIGITRAKAPSGETRIAAPKGFSVDARVTGMDSPPGNDRIIRMEDVSREAGGMHMRGPSGSAGVRRMNVPSVNRDFEARSEHPQVRSPMETGVLMSAETIETAPAHPSTPINYVRAYPRLEAPANVAPLEVFDLTIGLSAAGSPGTRGDVIIVPTLEDRFDLEVRVIPHEFTAVAGLRQILNVSRYDLREVVVKIKLRAPPSPNLIETDLEVEYSYGSNIVGRAWRKIRVVPLNIIPPAGDLSQGCIPLGRVNFADSPDLTVTLNDTGSGHGLEWNFYPSGAFKNDELENRGITNFSELSAEQFAAENIKPAGDIVDKHFVDNYLDSISRRIASNIPPEFWKVLEDVWKKVKSSHPEEVPTLLISSADPYIPWELASTDVPVLDQSLIDPACPPILGAQLKIGRWILEAPGAYQQDSLLKLTPETKINLTQMGLIVGNYNSSSGIMPLPEAQKEGKELKKAYTAVPIPDTSHSIDALLDHKYKKNGALLDLQVLHFACHGEVNPGTANNGIILKDGKRLTGNILDNRRLFKECQPLVFMNACEIGYSTKTLSSYGGMAGACLAGGSRGFIAPLWKVDDEIAREVAVEFYKLTLNDKIEISEALRRLRSRFNYKNKNPQSTYIAYIFYGHPKLKLSQNN